MNIGRMAWEDGLPNEIQVSTDWEYILDRVYDGPSIRSAPIENKDIRLIDHVLSGEEADRIIQEAETFGFGKTNYPKHYRGNLRLICEDEGLSKQMFERLQSCIPTTVIEDGIEWEALGLNEVWRLSKYLPGDRFGKHVDATFERKTVNPREKGMYTVNIYLNGGFDGGCTRFIDREGQVEVSIAPCQGLCLIFRQPPTAAYAHDGEELLSGVKYLLRSDVMYRSLEGRGQHLSLSP